MNYFFSPQYIVLFNFVFFQGRGNDFCLELSRFEALNMLDLQTKFAINSNILQVVRHEAAQEMRV